MRKFHLGNQWIRRRTRRTTKTRIRYHEAHPLEYNFTPANTLLIGRGCGLLSAAAVGLSPSISMIPEIAQHISRISFRFGLIVDQVCRSLEVSDDKINAGGAWVYCVHGVNEKDARNWVHRFNEDKVRREYEIEFCSQRANKCARPIPQAMRRLSSMSIMPDIRSA